MSDKRYCNMRSFLEGLSIYSRDLYQTYGIITSSEIAAYISIITRKELASIRALFSLVEDNKLTQKRLYNLAIIRNGLFRAYVDSLVCSSVGISIRKAQYLRDILNYYIYANVSLSEFIPLCKIVKYNVAPIILILDSALKRSDLDKIRRTSIIASVGAFKSCITYIHRILKIHEGI